ncbi:MAG: MMCAP2_0565 family pilin-like conjugal transfer protein [Candidatus Saccharimonadales bacterium]
MDKLRTLAAAINPKDIGINDPITNTNNLISGALTTVYLWAGIICVVIIIIAGFVYTTSAGSATKTKKAKDTIMGAVIGIVVVISAFVITQFIIGRF